MRRLHFKSPPFPSSPWTSGRELATTISLGPGVPRPTGTLIFVQLEVRVTESDTSSGLINSRGFDAVRNHHHIAHPTAPRDTCMRLRMRASSFACTACVISLGRGGFWVMHLSFEWHCNETFLSGL